MKNQLMIPALLLAVIPFLGCSSDEMMDSEASLDNETFQTVKLETEISQDVSYEFEEPSVTGQTFYIDPINGSMQGDGSQAHPWKTLEEVIAANLIQTYRHQKASNTPIIPVNPNAPVKGGDRLLLKEGYHGQILLNFFYFEDWLTIEGAPGEKAVVSKFAVDGVCKNLYLKNMSIIRESYQGDGNYWDSKTMKKHSNALLHFSASNYWGAGSKIKVNQLKLKTAENVGDWGLNDWKTKTATGIVLRSTTEVDIVNSSIDNVDFGMVLDYDSHNTNVVGDTINNFTKDGAQILSSHILFENNQIENALKIDGNHDDAIQLITRGSNHSTGTGVLNDVVIRGNRIIGHNHNFEFEELEETSLQGIGGFDGMYEDFVIENNVIVANNHHGITLRGARNCQIINNTVIDQDRDDYTPLYIFLGHHKNGQKSQNCTVANNIVSSGVNVENGSAGAYNNVVLGKYDSKGIYDIFVDPDNFDFHLLDNATVNEKIIDAGVQIQKAQSSYIDKAGTLRTLNPDVGAYERQKG